MSLTSGTADAQIASAPRPFSEEQRQQERERLSTEARRQQEREHALRTQQERGIDVRRPSAGDADQALLPGLENPCFAIERLSLQGELTLRVLCDDRPDARQLIVELPLASEVAGLLRWGSVVQGADQAGAARVVVQQVTAGGHPVPMVFASGAASIATATQGPVVLTGPGILSLDLRGVPGDGEARKSLLVNLQVQALIKAAGFQPVGATAFNLDMGVSLP